MHYEAYWKSSVQKKRTTSMSDSDAVEFSYRNCGVDGRWEGRGATASDGWTNYTQCYTDESRWMFELLFGNTSPSV